MNNISNIDFHNLNNTWFVVMATYPVLGKPNQLLKIIHFRLSFEGT